MKKQNIAFIREIVVVVCLMIITALGARNLDEDTGKVLVRITIPIIYLLCFFVAKRIIDKDDQK